MLWIESFRVQRICGLNNQTFSYTPADWLSTDTYDSNGNRIGSGGTNYQYDVLNHLTGMNNGSVSLVMMGTGTASRRPPVRAQRITLLMTATQPVMRRCWRNGQ